MTSRYLIGFVLIAGFSAVAADTLTGRVIKVADGDTLTVLDAKFQQHKIRLNGIDAPETGQPFGTRSQQHLSSLVFGRAVTIDYREQDRYGRILGKVIVNSQDMNLRQVEVGLAWHYKAYQADQTPADREQYAAAEIQARKANIGLWADRSPIPPWDWRKGIRDASSRTPSMTTSGCAVRRSCGQMRSCDEVRRYVAQCGSTGMDGDGDGIACESLCP